MLSLAVSKVRGCLCSYSRTFYNSRLDNCTGSDAPGANFHMFGISATGGNADPFQVWQPASAGFVVGVTNVISSCRFFPAYIAHF